MKCQIKHVSGQTWVEERACCGSDSHEPSTCNKIPGPSSQTWSWPVEVHGFILNLFPLAATLHLFLRWGQAPHRSQSTFSVPSLEFLQSEGRGAVYLPHMLPPHPWLLNVKALKWNSNWSICALAPSRMLCVIARCRQQRVWHVGPNEQNEISLSNGRNSTCGQSSTSSFQRLIGWTSDLFQKVPSHERSTLCPFFFPPAVTALSQELTHTAAWRWRQNPLARC